MPQGNIDPANDAYTRSSMLLGPEEYASTVQRALCANTGYLMYQPVRAHESVGGTAHPEGGVGTTSTQINGIYLSGGKYNVELTLSADAIASTASIWLQIGSVYVSSVHTIDTSGTSIVESFTGATIASGWHTVDIYATQYGEAYNCFSALRQYEEE